MGFNPDLLQKITPGFTSPLPESFPLPESSTEEHSKSVKGTILQFPLNGSLKAIAADQCDHAEDVDAERTHWRHRAEVSRAYAKILRGGGSLG